MANAITSVRIVCAAALLLGGRRVLRGEMPLGTLVAFLGYLLVVQQPVTVAGRIMNMVQRGLAETRAKAQAIIMSGDVYIANQKVDKAGTLLDPETEIEVRANACPYVSRGGLKLEKAMQTWPITLEGKICVS